MSKRIIISVIKYYQMVFAFYRKYPRCKFMPSCSDYMIMAVEKYGPVKGLCLGVWRILRCNPLAKFRIDLP
jgi:uncharacterized protein